MRETHPVPSIGGVGVTALGAVGSVSFPGASVSVAAGAGSVDVQTTAVVLPAVNTSRRVGFQVDHNQALASLITRAGDVAVMVAWLNDGTQTIQSLATGLLATGAAPALTGFLVTGVGWTATLNADHTVTLAVTKDPVITRAVQSRYWLGEVVAQAAP